MSAVRRIIKTLYKVFPIFKRPMAVCAVISCAAVLFLYRNISVSLSLLILFSILSVVLCVLTKNSKIIIISVLFLAVCASAVNEFTLIDELNRLDGKSINADFVAVENSVQSELVSRVTVYSCGSSEVPENTKFVLYSYAKKHLKCGQKFNASVKLTKLKDNSYKSYNIGNSVYMNCRLDKINRFYENNGFFTLLGKIRAYIKRTVSANYQADDAALVLAVNTGDRSCLSDKFYDNVLTCGVSHLTVVSGLHISIIIGIVFRFFEKFFYNRYLKAALSLISIFLICALCGFTVSVMRAGAMFLFSAISPLFMKRNDSLNSLGSAVVLLLFISPLCVLNVSFWLSVLSTAAVVWIAPFYNDLIISKLRIKSKIVSNTVYAVTVSICALIFTAPVSGTVFGYVSLLSPVSSVLLTIPVTVVLVCNSLGVLFSAFKVISIVSKPMFLCAGVCAKYIILVINKLGSFDYMCVDINVYRFLVFVFLIFALISVMYLYKFYEKLLRENYIREVHAHARNNRNRAEILTHKRRN